MARHHCLTVLIHHLIPHYDLSFARKKNRNVSVTKRQKPVLTEESCDDCDISVAPDRAP